MPSSKSLHLWSTLQSLHRHLWFFHAKKRWKEIVVQDVVAAWRWGHSNESPARPRTLLPLGPYFLQIQVICSFASDPLFKGFSYILLIWCIPGAHLKLQSWNCFCRHRSFCICHISMCNLVWSSTMPKAKRSLLLVSASGVRSVKILRSVTSKWNVTCSLTLHAGVL